MLSGKIGAMNLTSTPITPTGMNRRLSFQVLLDGKLVGNVVWFQGRAEYLPWLEIDYYPWVREVGVEVQFFSLVHDFLPPGGRLFVTYVRDPATLRMLYRGVHPLITPLGFSMLQAGFTWFKDWYFPEGGNEGTAKLQGNRPLNLADRARQLSDRLQELEGEYDGEEVRDWIRAKLRELQASR
ncbi:hypothetical protein HS1genome_2359 [Sulfodiicoccus acidiphilus]|uniref:DUF1122 domain-containing protein n=1 Tax=Sulfodiicoccus acidiphilus TaxID=1670455 RepID=A0A348B718_9CREN|nr:DUF1122 family protein [Sulfodiicoccus acidiphilus]BBD73970.1 hypothetical protein HS1genome_2359 [Sulfodiicoccus acidiphilus]GGU02718.1 hypothetical protein GCM10007116_19740 [Sulfodiicoccus acidiphilus]